jgi:TolA-binding protein
LSGGVSDDLSDNCHYWIGESYFGLKKYNEAIQHFETVVGMAGSDKADDAQLMIGNAYAAMGKKVEAKDALQKLITAYPASPLVKRAKAKMSSL